MKSWEQRVAGVDCPFDAPRTNIGKGLFEVAGLSISTLYLERIQTYTGHCVLVFDPRHVTRIDELSASEWQLLATDIQLSERALMRAFKPDHINIASLGQVVAHLHWHIIPRYVDDPRWGGPIWMSKDTDMERKLLTESEYARRAAEVREQISDLQAKLPNESDRQGCVSSVSDTAD